MTVVGLFGTEYQLDTKPLGSGGEGDIYRVLSGTDTKRQMVKMYHSNAISPELEEKLKFMVKHPPNSKVLTQVAWPLDIVYDASNSFCGFIMPELSINAELGDIYKYPPAIAISSRQKIIIAENICAVISAVHKAGYVFGDFNPRNIGVDKNTGKVAFLDTDSYHVIDRELKKVYRCNVCAPGYSAPELLEKCADYVSTHRDDSKQAYAKTPLPTFTQETDNFALAIHIFKLLNNGYTPFGGIKETESASQASPGTGDAAVRRDNYCFKPGKKPQSAAIPPLEVFPQELADLFTRAFIYGKIDPKQRPSAVEWHNVLTKYETSLVECPKNVLHQYDPKNVACPWCDADRQYAISIEPAIPQKQYATTSVPVKSMAYSYSSHAKNKKSKPVSSKPFSKKKFVVLFLILFCVFGILPVISILSDILSDPNRVKNIKYSEFTKYLELNYIESATINDNKLHIVLNRQSRQEHIYLKTTIPPENANLLSKLLEKNVNISFSNAQNIEYSDFIKYLELNYIKAVTISDNNKLGIILRGQSEQDRAYLMTTISPEDANLLSMLLGKNVNISVSNTMPDTPSVLYEQLIKASQAYFDKGMVFYNRDDWDTAIREFTDAINVYTNYTEAYINRANAYLKKGDNDRAIADYTKVIDLDPNNALLYSIRGNVYFNKKDNDRAIADYTRSINLDSNNPLLYSMRGNVYLAVREYDNAISDYTQAIRLDPNNPLMYSGRGDVYRAKREYDNAISDYTQAIRLNPNYTDAYYYRGRAYSDKKDWDRAIAEYTEVIRRNQNYADAYYYRGRAYSEKKDYDREISNYTQVIRLEPDNSDAYYYRGRAYENNKDYNRAIADYEQTKRLNPSYSNINSRLAGVYSGRAGLFFDRKDWDRAIADYTQVIQLNEYNVAFAYDNRGAAYFNKGYYNDAVWNLEESLKINPDNTFAKNLLERSRRLRGW